MDYPPTAPLRRRLPTAFFLSIATATSLIPDTAVASETPRLIVQVTVDQLRADLLHRYADRFGKNGFNYFLGNGTVYADAHHAHANTETIVGHATLATGAQPAVHGMVGNLWFDRKTGQTVYNIEDPDYRLLCANADVDEATEIDPTQKAAKADGRSPRAILSSTFSDELLAATDGKAKVFGVSIKDRGAVAMAGHGGKAFWFSKALGQFVTSTYYYNAYPEWVTNWNSKALPEGYANTEWTLLKDRSTYLYGQSDDREWETDLAGFGRTFPHAYGDADGKYFTTLLTTSPAGDALTLSFAQELIIHEALGKDDVTDYLSVSFSSTDYVGHLFGPSSLEQEDNLLRLDGVLADLLASLDQEVGLDNVLLVLSADHGGPDTPGYLKSKGIPAEYVDPSAWEKEAAIERIKQQFEIRGSLIEKYSHPYVYLSPDARQSSDAEQARLEQAIAKELQNLKGIRLAVSSKDLMANRVAAGRIHRAVLNNFYAPRSGDVYVVFEPNWFLNDFDGLEVASTHGSPWSYDSHVPVVFVGKGIKGQVVTRAVHTVDVAKTLSALIGIKAPSGAFGNILAEVLE
ncbi:alkaline phosphatase family protein [Motiliproteus sp. SC1-56]|uniref:alkaline phosphatase family protein n=1 Tax=Motiliproteus sp. SC1-56 TaxID=2799565 RepID=UPI001A905877|nr:alkaline phosphatase family protein [Motiliproteus sp. SC1-56]